MAGTLKNELPCRREHDFEVLSKSRKDLHFEVVLVPPFGAFGVSYRRKHGFQGCLIFVRFLLRLLEHFCSPNSPTEPIKLSSIFGTIFLKSADHRPGPIRVPSPPGTPLSSIPSSYNVHSASLRFPSSADPPVEQKPPTTLLPNPPPIKEGYREPYNVHR